MIKKIKNLLEKLKWKSIWPPKNGYEVPDLNEKFTLIKGDAFSLYNDDLILKDIKFLEEVPNLPRLNNEQEQKTSRKTRKNKLVKKSFRKKK